MSSWNEVNRTWASPVALGHEAGAVRAVVVVLVEPVDVGPGADVEAGAGIEHGDARTLR